MSYASIVVVFMFVFNPFELETMHDNSHEEVEDTQCVESFMFHDEPPHETD